MDGGPSDRPGRRPRADSVRNRERVLEAAKLVFGAAGAVGSLEEVARQAGVGTGTLYRHFPTRQALYEAMYRHEVDQLVALAEQLTREEPPCAALRHWLHANVEFVATKKFMSAALAVTMHQSSDLSATAMQRLTAALEPLVRRAADGGDIRGDIAPEEILRTVIGMCIMHDQPGWQGSVRRLIDVFVDGLRKEESASF